MPDRFREHRERLAAEMGADGIAVVPAATETLRNGDVAHEFRQDSDFFYLTGFEEPDAVCVLVPGHPEGDFHLFVRPRDPEAETWTGHRAGSEGALARYGADAAHDIADLDTVLPRLMIGREALFARMGAPDPRLPALLDRARSLRDRFGRTTPSAVRDIGTLLAELRLRKDPSEVESLRAAAALTAEGHREAMRFAAPGLREDQVQAAMEYVWRAAGSPRTGYPSIVASGPNAVILHYTDNDRIIEDGDLVLVDAAAEVDLYTADVTRTFPASGVFTAPQRAVYESVLAAHEDAVDGVRPGETFASVHRRAVDVLVDAMADLGLFPVDAELAAAAHLYRHFFMHSTSHWLGLDVHDPGAVRVDGRSRILEPGMCLTVEPGMYIPPGREAVEMVLLEYDLEAWLERRILLGAAAAKKREEEDREGARRIVHPLPPELVGIGVRIEDDLLVTLDGHENLSAHAPRRPDDVEAVCAESSRLTRE